MLDNGTMALFFALGVVATLGGMGILRLNRAYPFRRSAWLLAGMGFSLVLFGLAWAGSCVFERESQAAGMGLVFFGLPGITLLFLTRFFLKEKTA